MVTMWVTRPSGMSTLKIAKVRTMLLRSAVRIKAISKRAVLLRRKAETVVVSTAAPKATRVKADIVQAVTPQPESAQSKKPFFGGAFS